MKNANQIILEDAERLSRDFEVSANVFSKQTKTWLKELDARVESLGLTYDQCREAARKFKTGEFEAALKTIWKKKLEVDVQRSDNGGNITVKTYTVSEYAVFTERIEYKNGTFTHSITGRYSEIPTPGFSLGTVIYVNGKAQPHEFEIIDDMEARKALASRNAANIYNILFVGCDIHSKFITKPMLKLKKSL